MSEEKKAIFRAVMESALKKMSEVSTTAGSSSYEVHRSSGELIVRRSGKIWDAAEVVKSKLRKAG